MLEPLQARFGPFHLDEAEARLTRDGQPLELAPRAFQLLCELLRCAGHLVTKDALLDAVWGHRHVNEAALKNIVSQLRQALDDDAREPAYIETVSRHGYRFIAPLRGEDAAAAPAGLVGRGPALARLRSALQAAEAGQRQLVFVVGEAGIGKSSLIDHFMATAPGGVLAAVGPCVEHYGSAEPYLPLLEALNGLCRGAAGPRVVELLRRVAPSWLLQLPWLLQADEARALQQATAGTAQERMLREFGELVDRLAEQQPLLLVLEDLHWSDPASIQLLAYLARRRGGSRLMIVGSFRPTEVILQEHPLASLRRELKPRGLCVEIALEYLAETDLGELLAARLGAPPPEDFVRALHAHTLGLPLFVAAVLQELPAGDASELPETLGVPASITSVIEGQLARLSSEQRLLLGAASVAGLDFLHLPLAEVLGQPADQVQALLEDAAARLPWLQARGAEALADGRIAARHALAHDLHRQTLYDALPAAQRMQWHRRWAEVLARLHAGPSDEIAAELALHFERGGAPEQAAAQLALVATRAMARAAGTEALQAAGQGLALLGAAATGPLALELQSLKAVALTRLRLITDPEVAEALSRARALGPAPGLAWRRTLQGCWWLHFSRAEHAQARTLAAEMLALAERDDDAALRMAGLNAMGLVLMMTGEFEAARDCLESALAAHTALHEEAPSTAFVQDPGIEARLALVLVLWTLGQPVRARALAESTISCAKARQHPLSKSTALYAAAILHAWAGEYDTVLALTTRIEALVRRDGLPARLGGFGWLQGHAWVLAGRIEEGLALMRDAARDAQAAGLREGLAGFHYHLALACRAAGRPEEAAASARAGLDFADANGERMMAPLLRMEQALLLPEDAAAPLWRQALDEARAHGALFQQLLIAAAAPPALVDRSALQQLLARYEGDPSPVLAQIRDKMGLAARAAA